MLLHHEKTHVRGHRRGRSRHLPVPTDHACGYRFVLNFCAASFAQGQEGRKRTAANPQLYSCWMDTLTRSLTDCKVIVRSEIAAASVLYLPRIWMRRQTCSRCKNSATCK